MEIELTALKFGSSGLIISELAPANCVFLYREENEHDSSGIGYRAECKNVPVAWLPDEKAWYFQQEKNKAWKEAVIALRARFKADYEKDGTERWTCRITELKYTKKREKEVGFRSYSKLCRQGKEKGWLLGVMKIRVLCMEGEQ